MAINPYFPASYQGIANPYQVQAMQQLSAMQQTGQSNLIISWVQGIQAMKSFPLGANQKAFLFNTEENNFGVKSTDTNGMPLPLELFKYERITSDEQPKNDVPIVDTSAFVTREEFESRVAQLLNEMERKDQRQQYNNSGNNAKRDGERSGK